MTSVLGERARFVEAALLTVTEAVESMVSAAPIGAVSGRKVSVMEYVKKYGKTINIQVS
jgi:hypothetical protein